MIIYIRKNKSNVRLVIFTFVLHNGNRFFYFIQYRIAVLENSGGCLVDISPVFQKLHKNITQIAVVGLIILAEYFVTGGSSHTWHNNLRTNRRTGQELPLRRCQAQGLPGPVQQP